MADALDKIVSKALEYKRAGNYVGNGPLPEVYQDLLNRLLDKIDDHYGKNRMRQAFFELNDSVEEFFDDQFSVPEHMMDYGAFLNWPKKSCTVLSDRWVPNGFDQPDYENTELSEMLTKYYGYTQAESIDRQAMLSAAVYGISFVFQSRGNPELGEDEVVEVVRSALQATCYLSPRTGQCLAALEIIQEGEQWILYLPGMALTIALNGLDDLSDSQYRVVDGTNFPDPQVMMCVPYIFDRQPDHPYGQSRISKTLMQLTMMGSRTLRRSEVAAEFYQAPRLILLGVAKEIMEREDGSKESALSALTGDIWAIEDEEDELNFENRRADVKQITQMSMQPFTEQMRGIVARVSGETDIPMAWLGELSDSNPISEGSQIEAAKPLDTNAKNHRNEFTKSRRKRALNVACLLLKKMIETEEARSLRARWQEMDKADPKTWSDIITSLQGAGMMPAESAIALRKIGFTEDEVLELVSQLKREKAQAKIEQRRTEEATKPTAEQQATADLKEQADAAGVLVRAGATFESAMGKAGLGDIINSGNIPASLRLPAEVASEMERNQSTDYNTGNDRHVPKTWIQTTDSSKVAYKGVIDNSDPDETKDK